jgi:hypothetical protein
LVERTAMGWLVSPGVLISGLETAVDASPDPGLPLATAGLLALFAALWQRLGRSRIEEPPLAARPLAIAPAELELEMAAAREPFRAPDRSAARSPDLRPRWVRRMDEWAEVPRGTRHREPDERWDPSPDDRVPAGWLPDAEAEHPQVASAD